jgi:hypothetical protein
MRSDWFGRKNTLIESKDSNKEQEDKRKDSPALPMRITGSAETAERRNKFHP